MSEIVFAEGEVTRHRAAPPRGHRATRRSRSAIAAGSRHRAGSIPVRLRTASPEPSRAVKSVPLNLPALLASRQVGELGWIPGAASTNAGAPVSTARAVGFLYTSSRRALSTVGERCPAVFLVATSWVQVAFVALLLCCLRVSASNSRDMGLFVATEVGVRRSRTWVTECA